MLASGGADSDIAVWDLTSYTGICKLRGHKDAVTGLTFLKTKTFRSELFLISVSKDTLVKV
jgi:U3 small nucleolar RNA-associated protein 12